MIDLPASSHIQVPLAELVLLRTGPFGSSLHKSDYVAGGVPVVNPMHIVRGKILPGDDARIGQDVLERLADFRLAVGDVVLARRGEMGRCAVVGPREVGWVCGTGSLILRQLGALEPRYLQRFLSSPDVVERLEGQSVGSTMVNLNQGILRGLKVPVPPLLEQKRIADKLDALVARVDACRERIDRVPGILKRFRQAVLAAATGGELTREWREERGLDIEAWTRSTVGQLIDRIEAGLNVQCEERPPAENERGLVKISAVTWGIYDDNESKTLPRNTDVPEQSRIRTGDFLISRANTLELVGACVIVHQVTRPVFLSDKVLRLVLPDEWKPWLLVVLQSPVGRREIEERANGNQLSMRNLSQANLRQIGIPIPSPEERAEIVRRVGVLFDFADQLDRRCRTERTILEKLTPSMLAKAFRGELVPQDQNDEPADKLLINMRSGVDSKPALVRKSDRRKATRRATP